jgi:serine/threonine protein kinase
VKAIDKRRFKTKADKDTALREMSMYRWLFSNSKSISCIPQLHDMLEDQTHYYIVQEYEAGGGNLGSVLRDHGPLSEAQMRLLTRSLLEAVSKLHAQSICHNDLHLENVLIRGIGSINEVLAATAGNCRNMIKLCDLGRALCVSHQPASEDSVHHIRHSSLYYVAPEVLSGKSPGLASDMWSIGVILYVCFCGHLPFHCDPQLDSTAQRTQLKKQICLAEYSFPNSNRYWAKVSRSVKQFISSLLHPDPVVRMTCHEALSHPWIAPAIGEFAKTPRKSSIRRKAGNESPNHLNVELAQACEIHPLKVENPPAELTSHSKKSLVYRLWGKMKQKKHRATKSETDISTTASSALSSHSAGAATIDASPNVASNSTNGHHDRRHQSL